MIFDTLERLPQYKGIDPILDELIDFTVSHDLNNLPAGKTVIDGDLCWISSNVANMKESTRTYERHLTYLDLQIPLEEGEIISVRPVEEIEWPELNSETIKVDADPGVPLDLVPGTFAIFFPGDAHCCSLSKAGQKTVRKLVGKAKYVR